MRGKAAVIVRQVGPMQSRGEMLQKITQMMGANEDNLHVFVPKYNRIVAGLNKYRAVLLQLAKIAEGDASDELRAAALKVNSVLLDQIKGGELRKLRDEYLLPVMAPVELRKNVAARYLELKRSEPCVWMLELKKTLAPFKGSLTRGATLEGLAYKESLGKFAFLPEVPSMEFGRDGSAGLGKKVLEILQVAEAVSEDLLSPDIDPEALTDVIRTAIEGIRGIPELSRCGEAFDFMLGSTDLIKTNMSKYNDDLNEHGDGSSLLTSYVMDVMESRREAGASVAVLDQFRRIIAHVRKKIADNKSAMGSGMLSEMEGLLSRCG